MQLILNHVLGRLLRLLPKHRTMRLMDMAAAFFVPANCHYVVDDLRAIEAGRREPRLYQWLNGLGDNAVLFDVGTSYGQEAALASSFSERGVSVVGFDCNLYHGHFCALNKALNKDRFRFIFAAVGAKSGERITITANSDTHIPHLHKKNVPYSYEVLTIALDDFADAEGLYPTHMKIDVDGAETDVLAGARSLLEHPALKEVFIEIDNENLHIIDQMKAYGFAIEWATEKPLNRDILFKRSLSD